jgi:MraZ protein
LCQYVLKTYLFFTMAKFQGEYESTMDSKGRFLMPAAVKKQLPESENSFTISRGAGNCLTLYPKSTWDNILNKISGLNDLDPRVVVFKRNFLRGATEVSLDAAGKLNIQKSLTDYAGIDKDIVIFGVLSRFEIWDKTKYNEMFDSTSDATLSENAKAILDEYKINFND